MKSRAARGTLWSVAGLLVAMLAFLDKPPSREGYSDPLRMLHASDALVFTNLKEMVASSDAVVEASVADVAPGQEVGSDEDHALQFREATLDIGDVLFVSPTSQLKLSLSGGLVLEEVGWESGQPVIINNVQPSQVGDSGFYFLKLKVTRPSPVAPGGRVENTVETETGQVVPYVDLVSSQGRYLIEGGSLVGSNPEDGLVQAIQSMTPAQLRTEIYEARDAFMRGEVHPQVPAICPPPGCPQDLIPENEELD